MKNQRTQSLYILLAIIISVSSVSCKKRRAEKRLYGSYSRSLSTENFTDSTTQLLLHSTTWTFSNNGDFGEVITTGTYGSNVQYEIEKSDDDNYDLELKFIDLNYSDWLPKNYVNGQGEVYNAVVPNTAVLDQVRFYVKIDDNSLQFLMRYPNADVIQAYSRN